MNQNQLKKKDDEKNFFNIESDSEKSIKKDKNLICLLSNLGLPCQNEKFKINDIPKNFFNEIIYRDKKNDEIYHKICLNKILNFFEGKMDVVFLTFELNDSGKTHLIYDNFKDQGFIPLSFNDFFFHSFP